MVATGRGARGFALGVALLAALGLAGCSAEDTEGSAPPARPDTSLEAARTKLGLIQQDPCYTAPDLARWWPVCARWEEEVRNVARVAAETRADDPEITDPAAAVEAGHERFLRAGCRSRATATDPAACVAALGETRTAVSRLAAGIAAAR